MTPSLCSIIFPYFNMAEFIPNALQAILTQSYKDFELVAIDDGSSDNSTQILTKITADWVRPVKIIRQENQGSYSARNTGLDYVCGEYITFYDVDDLWLPNHLTDCIDCLRGNSDLDIVYTNCQMVDLCQNSKIIQSSVFHLNNSPNKFLELSKNASGNFNIITDPRAAKYQILYGLYLGLQFSVFKSRVFQTYRFDVRFRNEAEDQLSTVKFLKKGHKIGYTCDIHGTYNLHQANSSAASRNATREKKIKIVSTLILGYLNIGCDLTLSEKIAVNKRVSREYFWGLGYNLGKSCGDYQFAIKNYLLGIWYWPFSIYYYKSFFSILIAIIFRTFSRIVYFISGSQQ